ncbi:hybrid sensor histidine kinase/response regulator [Pseudooceanicola marinus]|nr:response regulator [Pseudooceanicola marinus]
MPRVRIALAALMVLSVLAVPALWLMTRDSNHAQREAAQNLPAALHRLERAIGYSGFIHHFKNAVLRPDDPTYYALAEEDYREAAQALRQIHELGIAIGTDLPMSALHSTLAGYRNRLQLARAAADEGMSIADVDMLVRISDDDATLDLLALEEQIFTAIAGWQTREAGIASQERILLSGLFLLLAISLALMILTGSAAQRDRDRRAQELNDRLAALGQVTAGLAHDVNNLLATIYYALELSQDQELPPAAQRYLQSATRAVARGKELTGRLLSIARPTPGTPESRALSALFLEVEALAAPQLEDSGVDLHFHAAEPGLMVHCDPGLLIDALLNLILNARTAIERSGQGGQIRVEARSAGAQALRRSAAHAPDMTLAAAADSAGAPLDPSRRYVELSVSDDGPGMSAEVRQHALEPFYTTTNDGTGVGLGLCSAFSFARGAGGDLRIDAAPGAGTVVQILLPRDPAQGEAEAETQTRATDAPRAPTRGGRVGAEKAAYRRASPRSSRSINPPRHGVAADHLSGKDAPATLASSSTNLLPKVARPISVPSSPAEAPSKPPADPTPGTPAQSNVADAPISQDATPTEAPARPAARRVLLAEDESGLRMMLSETLRSAGYEVLEAENGAVALSRLQEAGAESLDLLLTDVMMPELGGFGLAQAAREMCPDLPVVYLTGYVGDESDDAMRPSVPGPVLRKPCPPDRLLRTLTESLEGRPDRA